MLEKSRMIAESLSGRKIAITGSTGFVGTALVERLLRSAPGSELFLIIRGGRRGAASRVKREILSNDAFDRLRDMHANSAESFDAMTARRVHALDGDISVDGLLLNETDRALLASCDIVIHSAAAVSFDSPLDSAVEVNLLGPTRLAALLNELHPSGTNMPHLVAVSTCYVAGNRRGTAPEQLVSEGPFDIGLSWKAEVASARRLRSDVEAASRTPKVLEGFRKGARRELGAAGAPALAAKTEQLRERWVSSELVQAGRSRAASVGWPDAYAFTKALGEQALTETKGALPVNIVRPSIIESAVLEPKPGWIRGFRMAEPVIISYARGLLREFPGVPEGTVDVIPVDIVVAAIIAVAAAGPVKSPYITQVASGSTNPLRYSDLVNNVRDWFTEHPIYDAEGQPIVVPDWRFPGRGRVQQQLSRAKTAITQGERVLQALPLRGAQAAWSAKLDEKRIEVERALEYVELYGLYTECEAIYSIDNLLSLWNELDQKDQQDFCFDPRVVNWDHYVKEVHLPSVVDHARVKMTPGKTKTDRAARLRSNVLSPDRKVAAFDLENTLIASNVVESYSWLATRHLNNAERARYFLRTMKEAPTLLSMDRKDRSDFLRYFYRRYEDAPVEQIAIDARQMMTDVIVAKSFPAAIRRVREHRALGHKTILITGALTFNVEGLRPLFDEIVGAEMSIRPDGTYSGQLTKAPPTGETRAQVLADYCASLGVHLDDCVAYADSTSDLPLLEAVGHPVAVNPETRLASIARKRGWLVEDWEKAAGAPKRILPFAPLMNERQR